MTTMSYNLKRIQKHLHVNVRNKITRFYSEDIQHSGPLDGIKVLDLTRILAGPFCTMILGDLGANIIKIENPVGGDETRKWGPPFVGGVSCYFTSINRNKKSVALNLKYVKGRDICLELAKKSDILVENFVPGKLNSFGLGYDDIKKVAPHLIYCSITGYGNEGPYANRPGFDVITSSIGGLNYITGSENGDPSKTGVALTDLSTGLYAHGAIMAALLQRQKTGLGQKIDCDLLSTQLSLLVNIGSNYLNAEQESKRWGTAHESIVPYQSFKTMDGYFTVAATSNHQFVILCRILKLENLLDEPKYKNNDDRVKNRKALIDIISKSFLGKKNFEWLEVFDGCGIPYGPINNMKEVFNDSHIKHTNIVKEVEHPTAGTLRMTGPAVKYSSSSNSIRLPPPLLGQHTKEVLLEYLQHFNSEELDNLSKENVISMA